MAAVVFFQLNMVRSVNKASETKVLSLLSDNANQVKCVLDSQIDSIWANMDVIDSALKTVPELSRKEAASFLSEVLPRACEAELATADGEFFDRNGRKGFLTLDEDMDKLFLDHEQSYVLCQRDGRDMLMFGFPVSPVSIEGREYGFFLSYFDPDSMMDLLEVESFAGKGRIQVLDKEGFVIMSSDHGGGEDSDFFRLYQNARFTKQNVCPSFEEFRRSVLDGENRAVCMELENGDSYVVSYGKTERLDWYVAIVADYESVLGGLEKDVATIGAVSIAFIVGVVLISLFLVSVISANIYKILQEKHKLQELNASLDHAKKVAEQALEIAESANRSKSFFLSSMSHDIRTPINAITGFTSLLARNADNPDKIKEYTQKISASSRHLLSLINDVLDMSKIESGTTALTLTEERLDHIVAELDDIIRPQMDAKGHTFQIFAQNIVHERIVTDKMRLCQILMNLLTNAAKYTPEGGKIEMTISETKVVQNTAWYEFVVSDNGYGMSPEFTKVLFDSFTREEDSRTSRIQGTGLGMAITKGLVDLMGGSIDVKSQKGKGTVFTVFLQFQLGKNDKTPYFWEERGISHCLVVDDEEVVCQNVVTSMEDTGVRVDYTLDGAKALEMVQGEDPYHLVILDYKMPVMDGLETAREIRKVLPARTPILLLTGFDFTDLDMEKLDGVVDGVMLKPFFVNTLKQKLVEIEDQLKEEPDEEEPDKKASVFQGKRILIAEDNELNAEIIGDLLFDQGAECVICENGKLVVNAFKESEPGFFDLIFMDIQMPVMNGYEAARAIRACSHPDAGSIPILAMTADAFAEDVKAAFRAGMNAHISKPIHMGAVEEAVRKALGEPGR